MERLLGSWQAILDAMTSNVHASTERLPMVSTDERRRVLVEWNLTAAAYPRERCIHDLFTAQVQRSEDAIAVTYGSQSLTYAELNRRSNQLGRYLMHQGVGLDRVVGVCLERSLEMLIGVLGILKAGGAYVPLDPNYPMERLRYMLEDAAPEVVLTHEELMALLPAVRSEVIALNEKLKDIAGYVDEDVSSAELGLSSADLLYLIYTSGSTGRPKGTAMAHRSMVNLIEWHRQNFRGQENRRVLQFAALSFDVAFQEIFSTLCTGGTLVLLDEWVRRDARALMEFLSSQRIERLFVPPLMLQSLAECCRDAEAIALGLQDVITAGEQLRVTPEMAELFGKLAGCRLHNHYGPTETHVVTALTLNGDPSQWPALPAIGRPVANTQIYVLDAQQQPVPIGAAGEIYIGGAGVARGYLGHPQVTAQRFTADPFTAEAGARLYRSGDLGRWRADGMLEYLGRNDDQVKIRGYRIELGEIEGQLVRHERLRDAVVVAREDVPGEKRLVAYVTLRDQEEFGPEELRTYLKATLPEHMIPSAFVVLQSLPLTPSGKLNRRALPQPNQAAYTSEQYEPPQGDVEQALAQIWQELLHVPRVGRHDNFFELGGHSLVAVRLIQCLRQKNLALEVRSIYDRPTVAVLAGALKPLSAGSQAPPNMIPTVCEAITSDMLTLVRLESEQIERIVRTVRGGASNIQDIYPLTPLQEGLLFHHKLNAGGVDTYVLPLVLSLASRQRADELVRALQHVIDRHDSLRTAVLWEQLPRPVQVVYREATLPVEVIRLETIRDPFELLKQCMSPESQKIDMRRAPLMRLRMISDAHGPYWYALLQLHHFAGDHESIEMMLAEVAAHMEGVPPRVVKPTPFRNHVAQTLRDMAHRERAAIAFFQRKLGDIIESTAPFGLLDAHCDPSQLEQAIGPLESALGDRVRALARRLGVSPAILFHAAWGLVVACTSGRDDVVYGTVLLGRLSGGGGVHHTLGMFINTLPLRLRLQDISASDLIYETQRELAELMTHEQASLVDAQRCASVSGVSLFGSLLNYRHVTLPFETGQPELTPGIRIVASQEWANYPVVLSVDDQQERFVLTAQTNRCVNPQRLLGYVSTAVRSLVEACELAPETRALSLSVLPDAERRQIVEGFNATQSPYPHSKLIHEVFEEQARITPDAVAAVYEERSVTYAELNSRSNQLAHYLISQGVQVGERIPILAERGLNSVIAQLATIKSGATYVPIDPRTPIERQAFMIRDCGGRRVIADRVHRSAEVASPDTQWVDFEEAVAKCTGSKDDLQIPVVTPAAYVMYTSGSTGSPKGVIVPHRAVTRLVINNGYANIGPMDCIAHCSNPAFDASTFEIWGALLNGARVFIVPEDILLDARRFADVLRKQCVTVLWLTTALFNQRAFVSPGIFSSLRYALFGGEVSDPNAVRMILRESPPEHMLNMYGPTETTTFATWYPVLSVAENANALPIGRPIANTQVYILDTRLQPVPIGVTGEIYIGGAGVALGYLNRADLTAKRFIKDPFRAGAQTLLYKSGDLGRWREDGIIEFAGRNDSQVKIRGYRIELGEIEVQLARHEHVREAAVMLREDYPGEKRLVAYVTPRTQFEPRFELLRAHLNAVLPEYMIPNALVVLDAMPLTANGKLDRRALPAPQYRLAQTRVHIAPRTDLERALADIFASVIRAESIGVTDNFFDLGGQSLLATQLITRISEVLELEVPLHAVFETPTVEGLSAYILQKLSAELPEAS
jgi:amino acid adenylation domain-containing protein